MKSIKLPQKRSLIKYGPYFEYDKGFNHALMICKDMAIEQGFSVIEIDELDAIEEAPDGK